MSRYNDKIILKENQNRPYYKGKRYPNIPLSENDIYVITNEQDRLDLLAYRYYGDVSMWWVIAAANNNITKGSMYPFPGTQLRIPTNTTEVLNLFNNFNKM
jgi:phage tail protein X